MESEDAFYLYWLKWQDSLFGGCYPSIFFMDMITLIHTTSQYLQGIITKLVYSETALSFFTRQEAALV